MILTTTETICGKELEMLGLVKGSTIQTVNAVRDIGAGLKTLVGGELTRYNEMMNDARALATKRMVAEAELKAQQCWENCSARIKALVDSIEGLQQVMDSYGALRSSPANPFAMPKEDHIGRMF